MPDLVVSLLARLTNLFTLQARPEMVAVPIRRDDRRGPHRDDRRR